MPKKPAKTPASPPAPDQKLVEQRQKAVDRYGQLTYKLKPFRPEIRECEALASEIRSWYKDEDPAGNFSELGKDFKVLIGPKANERKVGNLRKLFKVVGASLFDSASLTLKAFEALYPQVHDSERGLYVSTTQSGSRTLDLMPRSTEAAR